MRIGLAGLLWVALSASANDDVLWNALQAGPGMVVFVRHAQPRGGNPSLWDESGKCIGEPMLTEEGREHAKRIGAEFAKRGIRPVVLSSPMCRCRDTATIAFGAMPWMDPELREVSTADPERMNRFERRAQALIAARRGDLPVVIVTHQPNIDRLTMELVNSGELVVARANGKGELEVLGKILVP